VELKRVSSMDLCGKKAVQEEMEDIVEKYSIKVGSEEEKERNWQM